MSQTIILSQGAYKTLLAIVDYSLKLNKDWVPFPDIPDLHHKHKYNYIQELTKIKGVLESRGTASTRQFKLAVDLANVIQSKRTPAIRGPYTRLHRRPKDIALIPDNNNHEADIHTKLTTIVSQELALRPAPIATPVKAKNNPVSTGLHKMHFNDLRKFVKEVEELSRLQSEDTYRQLSTQILELKRRLVNVEGDQERQTLKELNRLMAERDQSAALATVESLQETISDKEFARFALDNIVDTSLHTYLAQM